MSFAMKRSSRNDSVSEKKKPGRKDSKTDKQLGGKHSEFDQLLISGETILLTLSPHDKSLKKKKDDDGLDQIFDLMETAQGYDDQKFSFDRKPRASQPLKPLDEGPENASQSYNQHLENEKKRLEERIQQLNSELFKERSFNADLSSQVKVLLAQMEAFNRTSVHSLNSLDSLDTLNNINAMSKIETNTETSSSQESLDTNSNQNLPVVLDESQNLEKNELHLEINENKLPENEQTPSENPDKNDKEKEIEEWKVKYQELEEKCNRLSQRAIQTIQDTKLQLVVLQQENLNLHDSIREYQEELQIREEDKEKAMSLIPRLIEMVRKLQNELAEEKKKRDLDSEFDALHLQVTKKS